MTSSPQRFSLPVVSDKQSFDIEFQEEWTVSPSTVVVNGRNYSLSGNPLNIEWVKDRIPELKSHQDISLETLKERFSSLKQTFGEVIAIVGPSSVGKTTIVKTILEEEPDRIEEGADVCGGNGLMLMDRVYNHSSNNRASVFDVTDIDAIDNRLQSLGEKALVKHVLVYCPFHTLTERMAERNRQSLEAGEAQNIRAGTFPFHQYIRLFRPRQEGDRAEDVVDVVTKKRLEEDFDINWKAGKKNFAWQHPKEFEKASLLDKGLKKERIEDKAKLFSAFGFTAEDPPHKSVEMVPRKKYDLYINSNDDSLGSTTSERAQTAARRILAYKKD